MGLIARELEAAGIPTLCLSSALSITRSVAPPRAVFVDFPLGHTAGPPHDRAVQRGILRDALGAFAELRRGEIRELLYAWASDDEWKDAVMRPDPATGRHADDRAERSAEPVYQCERDRELAPAPSACPTCIWLE